MTHNPYSAPTASAIPAQDEVEKLTEKEIKNLKSGYALAFASIAAQVILPISMIANSGKGLFGFGSALFAVGILSAAFILPGIKPKVGKRILYVLGLMIFPINTIVTIILRKRAKEILISNGFKISVFYSKKIS